MMQIEIFELKLSDGQWALNEEAPVALVRVSGGEDVEVETFDAVRGPYLQQLFSSAAHQWLPGDGLHCSPVGSRQWLEQHLETISRQGLAVRVQP